MIIALKSIISCEAVSLLVFFDGARFGFVMSKAVQYPTNDDKIFKDLVPISLKFAQSSLQSYITLSKKSNIFTIKNLSMETFISCELWVVNLVHQNAN